MARHHFLGAAVLDLCSVSSLRYDASFEVMSSLAVESLYADLAGTLLDCLKNYRAHLGAFGIGSECEF